MTQKKKTATKSKLEEQFRKEARSAVKKKGPKKEKGDRKDVKYSPESSIELDLFENGLDFISNSLDHILNPPSGSAIKYSILHIHAGVELIFKELLIREHWSLIFQNVDLADRNQLKSGDFVSVNNRTALSRLNNICGIYFSESALQSIEELRKKRNVIEHYVFHSNESALKSIVSEVLIVILDLIDENFSGQDISKTATLNLKKIQTKSLDFKEFTEKKVEKIQPELNQYAKTSEILTCPNCFQKTFVLNEELSCLFCKYTDTPEKVVNLYIVNVLETSRFYEEREGGYYPLEECPDCEAYTLLVRDRNYICFSCLAQWDHRSLDNCMRCNRLFVADEEGGGVCGICWNEITSSND